MACVIGAVAIPRVAVRTTASAQSASTANRHASSATFGGNRNKGQFSAATIINTSRGAHTLLRAAADDAPPAPAAASAAPPAAAETSDEFEERLSALRGKRSKRAPVDPAAKAAKKDALASGSSGAPSGSSSGSSGASSASPPRKSTKRKGVLDFTVVGSVEDAGNWGPETIVYEGPPARGEIVANLIMSWTIVWVPLTIAAIGRGLWARYKITDKRVAVLSTSPLRPPERIDVPLDEIVDVIAIGRGVGLWGDMVITLRNQEKVEMRSLPNFKEIEAHIRANMGEADPEYAKIA